MEKNGIKNTQLLKEITSRYMTMTKRQILALLSTTILTLLEIIFNTTTEKMRKMKKQLLKLILN